MLEKFADFYEEEMEQYEGGLEKEILNIIEMRRFVFEVCKKCVEFENRPMTPHNQQINSDRATGCPICGGPHDVNRCPDDLPDNL